MWGIRAVTIDSLTCKLFRPLQPYARNSTIFIYLKLTLQAESTGHVYSGDSSPSSDEFPERQIDPTERHFDPADLLFDPPEPFPSEHQADRTQSVAETVATKSISQNLTVYIVGHKPLQVSITAGYSAFNDAVSTVLAWSDPRFLLYRPGSGPRAQLIWRAISIEDDYHKLLNTCRDVGALVKVVENSWFNSDAEDEVGSIQDNTNTNRADFCKDETPVNTTAWKPSVVEDSPSHNRKV